MKTCVFLPFSDPPPGHLISLSSVSKIWGALQVIKLQGYRECSPTLVMMDLEQEAVEAFNRLRAVDSNIHLVAASSTSDRRLMSEIGAFTLMKWPLPDGDVKDVFTSLLGSRGVAVSPS
jgi:hypothetical protein